MAKCSNAAVCFVNFISLLVAVPLLCAGFWLRNEARGECQRNAPLAIIVVGAVLLILSLLGIFGSCCRLNFFLGLYIFFLAIAIFVLLASIAFNFFITAKIDRESGSEHKLENSSGWLQRHVLRNWDETEKCLKELNACNHVVTKAVIENKPGSSLIRDQITPIQVQIVSFSCYLWLSD